MERDKRAPRPPMESVREAPFALRADDDGELSDGYTLDGYGAVFNRLTIIDSYEGRFKEKIAPGSMKRSFREAPPKIQFDHGRHPLIGSIPIAKLERVAEEVDVDLAPEGGAHVVARVFDNWLMEPVRDAIAAQAINGMSFRFSVVREKWETPDGKVIRDEDELMAELRRTWYDDIPDDELLVRTLTELKVPEIGPVTWPAYADTSVSMRSKVIDLGRIQQKDPEQLKLLAEAVFIADAASQDETAQRDTVDDESTVVEHPVPPSADAVTELDKALAPVGLRASDPDAQRSTSSQEPVGEHPSTPRRISDMKLRLMNQRDRLLNLREVGERAR